VYQARRRFLRADGSFADPAEQILEVLRVQDASIRGARSEFGRRL
jgi:hypothetical protein